MNKSENSNLIAFLEYPEHVFPVIKCQREENTLVLETFLRKKHRGKWYLWKFTRNAYVPEGQTDYTAAISSFNRDIYLCMLKGKVEPKLTYPSGDFIFKLDINQESELTRLTKLHQ